ncbi:unnamed protein product [Cuscuta campestris]|uniref:Uncharacterized protein n=1 Tax=Cuscuta campestris TaxID=132261 RepID=A0A484MR47_9ASTE|nr:unnamed protein product [Cuscuta campestris]
MIMDQLVSQQIPVAEQDHFYYLKESMDIPQKCSDDNVPLDVMDAPSNSKCPNRAPTLDSQNHRDSDAVIKFLTQILLEDNLDENDLSMSYDPVALRAVESSFYEALRQNPSSPYQGPLLFNNNSEMLHCTFGSSGDPSTTGSTNSSFDTDQWILNPEEPKSSLAGDPPSFHSSSVPNLNDCNTDSTRSKKHNLPNKSGIEEERSSKYSAVHDEVGEDELSEMFDKVLICADSIVADQFPSIVGCKGTNCQGGRKSHSNEQKDNTEFVDLESLLLSCARSIAAFDHGSAIEQLIYIRRYTSPTGDAYQRMAHAFANALEARLNGTGPQLSEGLAPNKRTGLLRSFMISWPVLRISYLIANKVIQEVASKGKSLHLIDFGIYYGIQWATLIRDLSKRPAGPPKLRITGIDYPVRGFRPEQLVVDTGRLLAKYCEQFDVPFEYNAITSQNWEKIKIDDLKLVRGEVVAVSCGFRLRNLMDEETVGGDHPSPRDAVLNLIREINPQVFVPMVLSASHSGPLFLPRFREALLFYFNYFDMFDATVPHDDSRLRFEQEFLGREIMNVIACEGMERVERPETYKQWHLRITKAGFKTKPMNQDLVKKLSGKVKEGYHKEFVFVEDGHWVLQGWKGRTLCGISCWVPRHFTQST